MIAVGHIIFQWQDFFLKSNLTMPRRFFKRRTTRRKFNRFAKRRFNRRSKRMNNANKVIARPMGGFPDRYFARHKIVGYFTTPAATTCYASWNFMSPTTGFGPSLNGGAYTNNFASGMAYLIGLIADTPAVAPYLNGRVNGCSFKIKITPAASGPLQVNSCLWPATQPTTSTIGFATASEQPYAKSVSIPGNQTSRPALLKRYISTRKLVGYRYKSSIEASPNFTFTAGGAAPTHLYYNLFMYGDGITNLLAQVEWEATLYVEYFNRTTWYSSVAPS